MLAASTTPCGKITSFSHPRPLEWPSRADDCMEDVSRQMQQQSSMLSTIAKAVQLNSEELKECKTKIKDMEEQINSLKKENEDIKNRLLNQERYKREWCLRIKGKKERVNENIRAEVLELQGKISPDLKEKLNKVVDVVHRVGRVMENKHRQIIILFARRTVRDDIWRRTKGSPVCKEEGIRFSEDLIQEDWRSRQALCQKLTRPERRARLRASEAHLLSLKASALWKRPQVIGRATAYKRLLLAIKAEYDDTIKELKRREDEVQVVQWSKLTSMSQVESLMTCRRPAAQLTNRIYILQSKTAELKEQINRLKSRKDQSSWIPGMTVAQSYHLDFLNQHLEKLKSRRAALMDTKSRCVPLDVKNKMDAELQSAECRREKLNTESQSLRILYKRLKKVCDCLSSWEEEEQKVSLEELISSTLENIRQTDVLDEDACSIDVELFESQEPKGLDESVLLRAHLDRFTELFDSAQFEEAAVLAARNPPGVLRNLDTMEMFKGVSGPPGSAPPSLLFFRALLISVQTGGELSADLSLQGVICALQQRDLRLVVYAVTQNILTFSEELGGVLTEHAQKNPSVADTCLALATIIYEACRLHRRSALSMCRRGLIYGTAEFMKHCSDVTAEDCMWVLCRSPSLSLLQLLTEPRQGRAAVLSVGLSCVALLVDLQHQQLALQLLDSFICRGPGVLQEVILEDCGSSVDVWTDVASLCSGLNRADLSRAILSILLEQSGTRILSPDLQGAELVEHIFL